MVVKIKQKTKCDYKYKNLTKFKISTNKKIIKMLKNLKYNKYTLNKKNI